MRFVSIHNLNPASLFIPTCVLFILLSGGWGCQPQSSVPNGQGLAFDLVQSSYAAADILTRQLGKRFLVDEGSLAAASFVNIDNLTQSSTFGRVVSEQIASRLSQNGLPCIDLKMRENTIYIRKEQGEFVLSREMHTLSRKHDIQAFLVGTYSVTARYVYVNTRIVSVTDNAILASHDYAIRLTGQIDSMLQAGPPVE